MSKIMDIWIIIKEVLKWLLIILVLLGWFVIMVNLVIYYTLYIVIVNFFKIISGIILKRQIELKKYNLDWIDKIFK